MRFSLKVAIPLMALSMPMAANASSGFYVSASSLFGQQKTTEVQTGTATLTKSVSTNVDNNDVVFTKPTLTKSVVSSADNNIQYNLGATSDEYLSAMENFDGKYISEAVTMELVLGDSDKLSVVETHADATTTTITTTAVNYDWWHNNSPWHGNDEASVTISPTDYTTQIAELQTTIKTEIAALSANTSTTNVAATNLVNAIGSQKSGFEASVGYKFYNPNAAMFFAPQIDYSRFQFGAKSPEALSIIGKAGLEWKNASVYGFAGFAGVQNANVSGNNSAVFGFKYGAGAELFIHKNIALFTEVFRIDLNNSIPTASTPTASTSTNTYTASTAVKAYITANAGDSITVTNNAQAIQTFTVHQLGLRIMLMLILLHTKQLIN